MGRAGSCKNYTQRVCSNVYEFLKVLAPQNFGVNSIELSIGSGKKKKKNLKF